MRTWLAGQVSQKSGYVQHSSNTSPTWSKQILGNFPEIISSASGQAVTLWPNDLQKLYTPPKTNMSPENQWLEDVFPIELIVPF